MKKVLCFLGHCYRILVANISESINSLLKDVCGSNILLKDVYSSNITFTIEIIMNVAKQFYIHHKIANILKSTLISIVKDLLVKVKDKDRTIVSFLVLILNYKYRYSLRCLC